MKFYNPHPGLLGCTEPIPEQVRLIANELVNSDMSLAEALDKLSSTFPEGKFTTLDTPVSNSGIIMLEVGESFIYQNSIIPQYMWRVISYIYS